MRRVKTAMLLRLACFLAATASCERAFAQTGPVLTWNTNSSVKLEQIIGDYDYEDLYLYSDYVPTASLTATRFNILANGLGYSFEDNGKLIFLFGDTISENTSLWKYDAADPLAWSTNTDGETPLLLNFFTNNPIPASGFTPIFVQPTGIDMAGFDVPNSGISLSNGDFLVCNTGSDGSLTNPQVGDFSELVTFNESLALTNPTITTNIFVTNRVVSMLNTNLDGNSPLQGHFIIVSMHEYGANVMMFGTGEYRAGDVFLCMIPTTNFVSGNGTLYFAGLTNGQPVWSSVQSNCVPVVQDNPTNGPAWPNDAGTVGNVSVTYPTNLGLWLMTYDGGRSANTSAHRTTGIYFSYAVEPWGPWAKPQLIFNQYRDGADGVFIYDANTMTGPAGPTIDPEANPPTTTEGGDFAPIMVERFTRVTNNTLYIYYTMSTWNPYTVVKMRSAFTIGQVMPMIDPGSLVMTKKKFSFSWNAPTNWSYQVQYTSNLSSAWTTITNVISSINQTFNFTDYGTNTGGLDNTKFYRLLSLP
jgi:hypothetical protein